MHGHAVTATPARHASAPPTRHRCAWALPVVDLRLADPLPRRLFEYIDWWNHRRLHGEIDMRTPAETEAAYYAQPANLTEAGTL
jgi:hypothetical protein